MKLKRFKVNGRSVDLQGYEDDFSINIPIDKCYIYQDGNLINTQTSEVKSLSEVCKIAKGDLFMSRDRVIVRVNNLTVVQEDKIYIQVKYSKIDSTCIQPVKTSSAGSRFSVMEGDEVYLVGRW